MSYNASPPSSTSAQSTRRDRMAAALNSLMANDYIDPELLQPGTQWIAAVDLQTTQNQNITEQPALTAGQPDSNILSIEPSLYAESPYPPLDNSDSLGGSVQNWLGEFCWPPSSSSSLQTDSIGSDLMLDLGWQSNDWDVILGSAELDRSTTNSTLPGPIAQTPQSCPIPLPSADDASMRPPSRRALSADRRGAEESTGPRPPKRQRAHYVIEKRYRAGLQERFEALRDCVEAWKYREQQQQQPSSAPGSPEAVGDGSSEGQNKSNTRLNKSEVLCQAVTYIKLLQEENEVVMDHMKVLIRRFRATKQALGHS